MKSIYICDRTGIVECEIFAAAYRVYGLNTVRYPVVQVIVEVKPFGNGAGYSLNVLRVGKAWNLRGENLRTKEQIIESLRQLKLFQLQPRKNQSVKLVHF